MHPQRVFDAAASFRAGEREPPRIVVTETADAAVVCWHVEPGQRIELHVHPKGQDTWIVLSGTGQYVTDASGSAQLIYPGAIAVAQRGTVHGAINTGNVPLRFVSVVSPALAGFERTALASSAA